VGDRLMHRANGRVTFDFTRLRRSAQLALAATIVALVVIAARSAEPQPQLPAWLPRALSDAGWVYLALAAFAGLAWLRRRLRRAKSGARVSPDPPV
jgi:hypothetical protein